MDRDQKSIGLTTRSRETLSKLQELGWFAEAQDIARLCLAIAVRAGVPEGHTSGTETRWSAGNFDDTGDIRSLLAALYPECKTPNRLMEHLVNEGLELVRDFPAKERGGPSAFLEVGKPSDGRSD